MIFIMIDFRGNQLILSCVLDLSDDNSLQVSMRSNRTLHTFFNIKKHFGKLPHNMPLPPLSFQSLNFIKIMDIKQLPKTTQPQPKPVSKSPKKSPSKPKIRRNHNHHRHHHHHRPKKPPTPPRLPTEPFNYQNQKHHFVDINDTTYQRPKQQKYDMEAQKRRQQYEKEQLFHPQMRKLQRENRRTKNRLLNALRDEEWAWEYQVMDNEISEFNQGYGESRKMQKKKKIYW